MSQHRSMPITPTQPASSASNNRRSDPQESTLPGDQVIDESLQTPRPRLAAQASRLPLEQQHHSQIPAILMEQLITRGDYAAGLQAFTNFLVCTIISVLPGRR